ncbi:MAG TPA: hypothetical protein VKU84_11435 [Stellaceae bacterium]|nr:hypothetical protein [Stellaceae bacterium]
MKSMRFYLGVFLVTASVLMLQIVQTRILSVVLWYYLAFLVISLAMFGITAGTVWVYLRRQRFSERTLSYDLTYFSSALAVATLVCGAIEMTLAPATTGKLVAIVVWIEFTACLVVPFFLSGVVVSLALTRSPYPIGRVYGVDLAGAAAGCLGVFGLLNLTDGPTAMICVAAIAALAAVCFNGSGLGAAPTETMPFAAQLLRVKPIFLGLLLCAVANGTTDKGLQPIFVKGRVEAAADAPMFTQWNTFSRIAVFDEGNQLPQMWGPSPAFNPEGWSIEQRRMNIDGDAGTVTYRWDGDVAHAAFLRYDVTNLAHFLPGHQRAAVIGVGGGRDLLSAGVFGVPDITGIELNPILARLLTRAPGFAEFSNLGQLPGLHLHVDEARSWFTRSSDRFDIIQMSLIDTWAATGAGAFTLSENGLYTVEAWRTFLDHLTETGVFTVSRWYARDNVNETGRMVSLAAATLLDLGAGDPSRHIFLAASGNIATLIVSRSPLSPPDVERLSTVADEMQYQILLSPDRPPASPVLGKILASRTIADLRDYTSGLALDLTPPTDERPFFFNQLPLFNPWRTIELAQHNRSVGAASGNIVATTTLILLFLMSLLLVSRTIVYPLRPAIGDVGRRLALGGTAYFLLIGVGFMCAEIGLLQRMSVFLGHPIYSLSIVLFSLISATGIGSLMSDRLPLATRGRFVGWSLITAGYLFVLPFWLPPVLHDFGSATLILRASLCVLAIAPAGLLMGYGFPTGMRFIAAVDRTPTPWFWGINGAAGVLASSFAVAVSIAFGIYVTMIASALCYALLIPAGIAIGFRRETAAVAQVA